jgi:hypothetical protein
MGFCWYMAKGYTIVFGRGCSRCFLCSWCYIMDAMNIYTLEFYSEEDDTIDEVIDFVMEQFPDLQFDVYKENLNEQLQ